MPESNSMPFHIRPGGETLNNFTGQVEDEHGLPMNKSDHHYVQMLDADNKQQNIHNTLPAGASVTMTNQPNSVPFLILSGGETLNSFMKRVEDERGLSVSKSGVEHIQIKFPSTKYKVSDSSPKKKRSFFCKLFNW